MRIGPELGPEIGLQIGAGPRPQASAGLDVTADGTSGIYVPADATEWDTLLAEAGIASGGPGSLWLLQEASGNPADTIGARTLTAAGSPAYQQAVAGWSRKAVTMTAGGANKFTTTIPAANTTSFLGLFYVAITGAPGATRKFLEHPNIYAEVTVTPRLQGNGGSVVTGAADPGTTVHAIVLKSNVTNTTEALITEAEVLAPTWFADTTATLTVGGSASTTAPMAVLYGAAFTGAAAEITNAQIKTLLQTLGWTVAW